jgi:predicted MFS family arabinose efflux permease
MKAFRERIRASLADKLVFQFFVMMFLWSIVEGMLIFYLPIRIEEQLQSLVIVGLLFGLGSLASVVTDLVFAFVSELTDYRRFLYIGITMYLMMMPLLLFGEGILAFILLVLLWGAQFEMFLRFAAAIFLSKHAPNGDYESASSTLFVLRHIGYFIGPVLADYVRITSHGAVIILMIGLLIFNLFYMYIHFHSNVGGNNIRAMHRISFISEWRVVKRHFRKVLPHLLLGFGIGAFEGVFLVFGPIEFDRVSDIGGLITGLGLLSNVFIPPLALYLLLKYRARGIILVCSWLTMLGAIFFLGDLSVGAILGIVVALFSVNAVMLVTNEATFLRMLSGVKLSEEDEVVSVNGLGPNLAYALVAMLGGVVMSRFGFSGAVIMAGGIVLICSALFMMTYRPPEPKQG